MKKTNRPLKCPLCKHALSDFSADAYCTKLDCMCHPHGACGISAVPLFEEKSGEVSA